MIRAEIFYRFSDLLLVLLSCIGSSRNKFSVHVGKHKYYLINRHSTDMRAKARALLLTNYNAEKWKTAAFKNSINSQFSIAIHLW